MRDVCTSRTENVSGKCACDTECVSVTAPHASGHAGSAGNEYADCAASLARGLLSPDNIPSFWLDRRLFFRSVFSVWLKCYFVSLFCCSWNSPLFQWFSHALSVGPLFLCFSDVITLSAILVSARLNLSCG